jgi:ubiquinone/menaquinone biosynthesis C-methylase UbiE
LGGDSEDHRVAEWYNTLSSSYDELYGQEQLIKHRAVIEFIRNDRFKILIDIGCGSGTLLQETEQFYEIAVGIDLSKGMLKAAKTRKIARTDLVLASSRMLPIKDETVDCVVSISTLKGDSKLAPFLSEMNRVCGQRSVQVLSLFLQPECEIPLLLTSSAGSSRVSDRETIYFLRSNRQRKTNIEPRALDSLRTRCRPSRPD